MRRHLAPGVLTALLAACADPTATPAPPALRVAMDRSANAIEIAVIGDAPYGPEALRDFPALADAINAEPKVRLVVHIGDIKSGSTVCSDAYFDEIARQFALFRDPLVYAIGDNEWTDCHRPNNGGYVPTERLAKLREVFFAEPGQVLGGRNMTVEAQPGYPENQLWVESRVTFAALHVVGSNNGLAPWTGETPAMRAVREAEVAGRVAANLAWLEHAFAVAAEQGSAGVALFFQADMYNPFDRALGVSFSGHTAFVQRLAQLARAFGGPVLLVSGDSHDFREDPGVPWFSLYGVTPPANVTQVIVDRALGIDEGDVEWLRLRVDPRSEDVFSWERVIAP